LITRYLVLLVHGGLYTDTDTACTRPVNDWEIYPRPTSIHPLIASLPYLLNISEPNIQRPVLDLSQSDPSLVVAVEVDSPHTGKDWRFDQYVRGIQIVQWTIMAKKGHPVLLEVLGKALDIAREIREKEEVGEEVDIPSIVCDGFRLLGVH
jgi:alpha 1,6-mannosyltransferase